MSTKKTKGFCLFQNREKVTLIATIITVILLLAIALGGYYWGFLKGKNATISTNEQTVTEETGSTPVSPTPPVIFAYAGEVSSIEDKTIHLKTEVQEGRQQVEKDIKVTTSDNTQYSRVDISKPPLPPGSNEEQTDREKEIQYSEIQVGDRIIAQAGENIKGKVEFEAIRIRVLVEGV